MTTRRLFRTTSVLAALILLAFLAIGVLWRPDELPPGATVYETCETCGLERAEIDELVATMRADPRSRAELVESWKQTAESWAVDLCKVCVDAVLDEAGHTQAD